MKFASLLSIAAGLLYARPEPPALDSACLAKLATLAEAKRWNPSRSWNRRRLTNRRKVTVGAFGKSNFNRAAK